MDDFPKDIVYTVDKLLSEQTYGCTLIKYSYDNGNVQEWKDFLSTEVPGTNSLDENGALSDNCLTYGKIIEMREDDWKKLFNKTERKILQDNNNKLSIYDIKKLELLSHKAPKETLLPENIMTSHKYDGVYLWAKGYQVEKFLGSGSFGSAWACKSNDDPSGYIVMKVLSGSSYSSEEDNRRSTLEEIDSVKTLQDILVKDKTGMANRYLLHMQVAEQTSVGVGSLIKSALADGDLFHITANKYNEKGIKKSLLPGVLRKARQALKAVKALHDQGISHNDIKLENILRVQNWDGKKEKEDTVNKIKNIIDGAESATEKVVKIQEINIKTKSLNKINEIIGSKIDDIQKINQILEFINSKKLHKHSSKMSDFGTFTNIVSKEKDGQKVGVWSSISTPGFVCENDLTLIFVDDDGKWYASSELIAKRDVYALGVTLLELLGLRVGINYIGIANHLQELKTITDTDTTIKEIIDKCNLDSKDTIIKYLELVKNMINVDYKKRFDLNAASDALSKIK